MAKATKTTERVRKVICEDKDVINVTMSAEEAHAVYSALWLIEVEKENDHYVAFKGVQDALGVVLGFPVAVFRFDKGNSLNNKSSVFVCPRD